MKDVENGERLWSETLLTEYAAKKVLRWRLLPGAPSGTVTILQRARLSPKLGALLPLLAYNISRDIACPIKSPESTHTN